MSIRKITALILLVALVAIPAYSILPKPEVVYAASITPNNGRVDFVADWDPDIYWELNSTNLGTNFGDSVASGDDNTAVIAGDISTQESYDGMNNRNDDGAGSDFDIHLINDAAMLIYIPANMTHLTSYGLYHNGGGTNAQSAFLRPTATGVELVCDHNNTTGSQDSAWYEIPDADLPGWFVFSCQYNSHGGVEGDMALWLNGTAQCSGTRTYTLDYGSGDPDFGFSNSNDPDIADAVCSFSSTDHGTTNEITGSGILIANFASDNPSGGASDTSPGNGDTWHTDYYADHVSGGPSDTCTYGGSGDWTVHSDDNCVINTDNYVTGDLILLDTGTGNLSITANGIISVTGSVQSTSTDILIGEGGILRGS